MRVLALTAKAARVAIYGLHYLRRGKALYSSFRGKSHARCTFECEEQCCENRSMSQSANRSC